MASKAKKKKQVVAGLVVRRKKDGKILVIKRTDGRWDLPKGHRDPGESRRKYKLLAHQGNRTIFA